MISLIELVQNRNAKVIDIQGGQNLARKLQNLGIRKGVTVRKITPVFSSGPIIIKAGNSEIALGRGMASRITVELI